jgi:CheY-like chemotaxis protein
LSSLDLLVVDDDEDVARQLKLLLPEKLGDLELVYDFETDFDVAVQRLKKTRYDILLSDIYLGRETKDKKPGDAEIKARELVNAIRDIRACPIVLFTDGLLPEEFQNHSFIRTVDKGAGDFPDRLSEAIEQTIATGIPLIARRLHKELDYYAGSYLWGFVEKNWDRLKEENGGLDAQGLERVIRRRAAFQIARLIDGEGSPEEREDADPCDYYIMPPIGKHLRLGEILRNKEDGSYRVVLTPHCYLVVQANKDRPKADFILTLKTVSAKDLLDGKSWGKDPSAKLRNRSSIPSRDTDLGLPVERYCFLPGFLDVPDLYCDLMQTEAIPYHEIGEPWERVAALDTPFAEALQSSHATLFGSVGLPSLNIDRVKHLLPKAPLAAAAEVGPPDSA